MHDIVATIANELLNTNIPVEVVIQHMDMLVHHR